jgi:hypothetical protein
VAIGTEVSKDEQQFFPTVSLLSYGIVSTLSTGLLYKDA